MTDTNTVAKMLDSVAEGLRMGSLVLGDVEVSQPATPTVGPDGTCVYKPTGEVTFVMTYTRKAVG